MCVQSHGLDDLWDSFMVWWLVIFNLMRKIWFVFDFKLFVYSSFSTNYLSPCIILHNNKRDNIWGSGNLEGLLWGWNVIVQAGISHVAGQGWESVMVAIVKWVNRSIITLPKHHFARWVWKTVGDWRILCSLKHRYSVILRVIKGSVEEWGR